MSRFKQIALIDVFMDGKFLGTYPKSRQREFLNILNLKGSRVRVWFGPESAVTDAAAEGTEGVDVSQGCFDL